MKGGLLAALLALGACQDQRELPVYDGEPIVRDSAGITIVENPAGVRPLGLKETLRIGEVDGEEPYLFSSVWFADVNRNGVIAVANEGSRTVRLFDSTGTFLVEVGGPGNGPAEFGNIIYDLALTDSSLAVLSAGGGYRLSIFGLDGTFKESTNVRIRAAERLQAWDASFRVWSRVFPGQEAASLGERLPVEWSLTSVDPYADTVGDGPLTLPAGETVAGVEATPVFEPQALSAPGPNGTAVTSAEDGYELTVLAPDGRVTHVIRRAFEPRAIDEDVRRRLDNAVEERIDSYRDRGLSDEEADQMRRAAEAATPRGELVPPVSLVAVGVDGSIWVRRIDLLEDPLPAGAPLLSSFLGGVESNFLDIFGPDGIYVGTLETDLFPSVVSRDWMLAVVRDDLGVEYVVRYDITAP